MTRLHRAIANISFFIAVLLAFLLIFQDKVSLPPIVQSMGRAHVLFLHLPIGIIVLLGILRVFRPYIKAASFDYGFIFQLAVLFSLTTCLLGFFLIQEQGYDTTLGDRHRLLSLITTALIYLSYVAFARWKTFPLGSDILLLASLVGLIIGSHNGAELTHGKGFLLQPLKSTTAQLAITDSTSLYQAMILPIFEAKCISCHNPQKAKGGLDMTTVAAITAGGKNGVIWVPGDTANSTLIHHIHLPLEDKKHMPPQGKVQLTPLETFMLLSWISSGADTDKPINDYAREDTLYLVAKKIMADQNVVHTSYDFKAAPPELVQSLIDPFCTVSPISQSSPALKVTFFVREKYNAQKLNELTKIKDQIVELNMDNMPVSDEDLAKIALFPNLERLIINYSSISQKGLAELVKLKTLKSLAVSGTKLDQQALKTFGEMPSLKEVFIWNTQISEGDIHTAKLTNLDIHTGYQVDTSEILMLTAPMLKKENSLLGKDEMIELKHQIPGVTIRYTTDGTTPDSLSSPEYIKPLDVEYFGIVKAMAVKQGWLKSPSVEFSFFKKGIVPTTADLMTTPNQKYRSTGSQALIDLVKGNPGNLIDGSWLGFKEQPLEALFYFEQKPPIHKIILSYNKSVNAFLMPPTGVEIWAGDDKDKLKLIKKFIPEQLTKKDLGTLRNEALMIDIKPISAAYYRIKAQNITKLPAWHPGKGQQGWLFVDEVFFYGPSAEEAAGDSQ